MYLKNGSLVDTDSKCSNYQLFVLSKTVLLLYCLRC